MYEKRCYFGFGKPDKDAELRLGPNITDWPHMPEFGDDLLVKLCAVITDEVTTTDELIPSGETSSYRSNPVRLSDFALSRRVPEYVGRSKSVRALEEKREAGEIPDELKTVASAFGADLTNTTVGSAIFARKPGDGSAREQAASCQKVLGGFANFCFEYATKRYRSNCINWGIVPFTMDKQDADFDCDSWVYVPGIRKGLLEGSDSFTGYILKDGKVVETALRCNGLTEEERQILVDGCLINYYANNREYR